MVADHDPEARQRRAAVGGGVCMGGHRRARIIASMVRNLLRVVEFKLLAGAAAVLDVSGRNMLQAIVFGMLVFTGLRLLHVFQ